MFCSKCGNKLLEGSKFCSSCGTPVLSNNETVQEPKRKTVFDGKIIKCPSCGATLKSFEHKCPECGYEIRSSNIEEVSVKSFADKLGKAKSVGDKNELISNFYIPNTKEDIYEFFILAVSNLNTDVKCEKAWKSKLEQTYHKAKISFGNSSEFEYINKIYSKTMKEYRSKVFSRSFKKSGKYIVGSLILVIGIGIAIFGGFKGYETNDSDSPFYMLAVFGMMIAMISVFVFTSGKSNDDSENKKPRKSKRKEEVNDEEDNKQDDDDDNEDDNKKGIKNIIKNLFGGK